MAMVREDGPGTPVPVVAIGGSAGGLEAAKELFQAMPEVVDAAFVLVLHIPAERESLLPEILARHANLDVEEADRTVPLEAGRLYVAAPGRIVRVRENELVVEPRPEGPEARGPVDELFLSLAAEHAERAVAIVLSGSGQDGREGASALRLAGGTVLVQDPAEAGAPGMPRALIESEVAQGVFPASALGPAALVSLRGHAVGPAETGVDLAPILDLLRRVGRDFGSYKPGTLGRRIGRRMALHQIRNPSEYRDLLERDPDELARLQSDLLIQVTSFFRDAGAYEAMRAKVLPDLARRARSGTPIRVWVPGCASGEEAYSILIAVREALDDAGKSDRRIQLFGTDVDPTAIERARRGVYPASIAEVVPPARLARAFESVEEGYRIRGELRDQATFAVHNVLADPPFSRLHLVSCRNLLIYFSAEAQERVLGLLHFALEPEGYLFLGAAETIAPRQERFRPVDRRHRIYQRIGGGRRVRVEFGPPSIHRRRSDPSGDAGAARVELRELGFQALLAHYAPCGVLVGRDHSVLCYLGRTERYLVQPPGEPTQKLLDLAPESLRGKLRTLLHLAGKRADGAEVSDLVPDPEGGTGAVRLGVRLLRDTGRPEDPFLVVFEERPAPPATRAVAIGGEDARTIDRLERELESLRCQLEATIEQLETSNEELHATNEEMMSINEEFQSTNQELETSKEELQSLNEELSAINAQLEEKVRELEAATNDLNNLLTSTDIGTIFLDRSMRIKRYTPAAEEFFRLIPADVGRPLSDIATDLIDPGLLEGCRRVLENLVPVEEEVASRADRVYLRRILPYRTEDERIEGVVVTFVEITARKRAEEVRAHLAAIVESAEESIIGLTLDGVITTWNTGAERLHGYAAREAIGRPIGLLVPPEREEELVDCYRRLESGERIPAFESVRVTKAGRRIDVLVSLSPVIDPGGRILGIAAITSDITQKKRAEAALVESERRFRLVADAAPVPIWIADSEERGIWFNRAWLDYTGRRLESCVGEGWKESIQGEDRDLLSGAEHAIEFRLRRSDGAYRWHLGRGAVRWSPEGGSLGYVFSAADIEDQKEWQRALEEADRKKDVFLAVLGHELRNPLATLRSANEILKSRSVGSGSEALVARIEIQVDRMSRLLDDLLDVSRITHGRIELRREVLEVEPAIRRVVESFREALEQRRLGLEVANEAGAVAIEADPTRFEQILVNLVSNAIAHGHPDGSIEVAIRPDASGVRIDVRDDGEGFDRVAEANLFEPFQGSRLAPENLGLGLALARQLIELHGGRIEASSEGPGRGSTFSVLFPAVPLRKGAAGSEKPPEPGNAGGARRILVVDDDADQSELLAMLLAERGHQVEVAHDGEGALEAIPRFRPDVVFLDIGMPRLSGYEVAERLRSYPERSDFRLVALSGYGHEEARRRAIAAGFDDHVIKGTKLADLVAIVDSIGQG